MRLGGWEEGKRGEEGWGTEEERVEERDKVV